MKGRALLCAWILLICTAAVNEATAQVQTAAPPTGSVIGTVVAEYGSGMVGVLVVLEPLGRATSTDYNGTFAFADLDPGTYSLVFSVGDLEARIDSVEVRPREVYAIGGNVGDSVTRSVFPLDESGFLSPISGRPVFTVIENHLP